VPGISPLDVGAAGIAAASASNPSLLATVLGRPAVRAGITSPVFQRNMLPNTQVQAPGLLNRVTSNPLTNYGLGQMPQSVSHCLWYLVVTSLFGRIREMASSTCFNSITSLYGSRPM
jgi:uncharacterized protein YbcC (UPF0753/DUF2309 family)